MSMAIHKTEGLHSHLAFELGMSENMWGISLTNILSEDWEGGGGGGGDLSLGMMHRHTHTEIWTYTHVCKHKQTCTHTHTHTHTHTQKHHCPHKFWSNQRTRSTLCVGFPLSMTLCAGFPLSM